MQYEDEEVWKFVENTNNYYSVSSHGRVRSEARVILRTDGKPLSVAERILVPAYDNKGYPVVSICLVTSKKVIKVHRLVAQAFCEKPDVCDIVNHIDNTVTNNHFSNLEWVTCKENIQHSVKQGRHSSQRQLGEANFSSKYNLSQIIEARRLVGVGESYNYVATKLNINRKYLNQIIKAEVWNFPKAFPEYYEAL